MNCKAENPYLWGKDKRFYLLMNTGDQISFGSVEFWGADTVCKEAARMTWAQKSCPDPSVTGEQIKYVRSKRKLPLETENSATDF